MTRTEGVSINRDISGDAVHGLGKRGIDVGRPTAFRVHTLETVRMPHAARSGQRRPKRASESPCTVPRFLVAYSADGTVSVLTVVRRHRKIPNGGEGGIAAQPCGLHCRTHGAASTSLCSVVEPGGSHPSRNVKRAKHDVHNFTLQMAEREGLPLSPAGFTAARMVRPLPRCARWSNPGVLIPPGM
jgi:hypothetical protein